MKKSWLFSWLFLAFLPAFAQENTTGNVQVIADGRIQELLDKKISQRQADSTFQGYRVQLFISSDRKAANDMMEKFRTLYPGTAVYLKFDSPNFKVRVGDYTNKLDAQYLYHRLAADFPNLFLVPDRINPVQWGF